jgi:hypothetical protein
MLSPHINIDSNPPDDVLDALYYLEIEYLGEKDVKLSVRDVKEFLSSRFGNKLANKFKTAYLYSSNQEI